MLFIDVEVKLSVEFSADYDGINDGGCYAMTYSTPIHMHVVAMQSNAILSF